MTDITIIGNTCADPELRYATSGTAVLNVSVAVNHRVKGEDGQWTDGTPDFFNVVAFKTLAENVAESVPKGTQVIVKGRLQIREWEGKQGDKMKTVEVVADNIGVGLQWATVPGVTRTRGNQPKPAATPPADGTGDC
jgi:single-strand DNA-binding protein